MKRARASGTGKTARRKGMPLEKKAGQGKRVGEIGRRRRLGRLAQEAGQPHQFVPVGFASRARHRAPGSRRNVNQIVTHSGRGARRQIKPEAEFGKEGKLKARHHRRRGHRIVKRIENGFERAMNTGMRLALGQEPAQRREMGHAVERMSRGEEIGRAQVGPLDRIIAKMVIEPRPPGRAQGIARLQYRAQAPPGAAAHQAEMAAARLRHQFENDA